MTSTEMRLVVVLFALAGAAACGSDRGSELSFDVGDVAAQVAALDAQFGGAEFRAERGFRALSEFSEGGTVVASDTRPDRFTTFTPSMMFNATGEVVVNHGGDGFVPEDEGESRVIKRAGTVARWVPGLDARSFAVNGRTVSTDFPFYNLQVDASGRVWVRLRATSAPLHENAPGGGYAVYAATGELLTTVETDLFDVVDAFDGEVLTIGGTRATFGTWTVRTLPALR
mgnify:CR=1 FL=1